MKKLFLLILFFATANTIYAQKVKSSCTAAESIKAQYRDDAERMALRRVIKVLDPYIDSTTIPKKWSDTILNALIAVYNADSLPASDTVTFIRKLHTFPNPVLNNFYMAADSSLPWMQRLRKDSLDIGNDSVGYLIKKYNLKVARYYRFNNVSYHIISFDSKGNYNLEPITKIFNMLGGVHFANKGRVEGDGNDIKDVTTKNFVELVYSFGWGDCFAGCKNKRYWKFNVYYNDCTVEYMGSYGSKWDPSSVPGFPENKARISPNPFKDKITFSNLPSDSEYKLFHSSGQLVKNGKTNDSSISNLEALPSGIYFLQILTDAKVSNYKLIKE